MNNMTPEEFIQDRYDLNSEQLDDWRDQMKKLRGFLMIWFYLILDL